MGTRLTAVLVSLPAPPGNYDHDLARTSLDDGDDLIHGDVTEAAKLRRQFFDTRRQGPKRNRLGYDAVDGNREVDMGQRLGFFVGDDLADFLLLLDGQGIGFRGKGLRCR